MISTQRLLMIFIAINLLAGTGITIYNNPTIFEWGWIDEENQRINEYGDQFTQPDAVWTGIPTTDTSGEGKTIGNPLKTGQIILTIAFNGILPVSINKYMFTTTPERIIADIIMWFRVLASILIGIEMYLVIKNKKTS